MKLTSIEIHPEGSSEYNNCVLSFRDPQRSNPYNIIAVDGLSADQIVPYYYGVSGNPSLKYYNLMLQNREVIFRIELNPSFEVNETYSDLRDRLFKMISSTRTGLVWLRFKNGNSITAITKGFITKLDASTATNKPEVQITVLCSDPMLQAQNKTIVDINGFDPGYTILTDDLSTAPHGFRFGMNFTGETNTLTIEDPTNLGWKFEITPVGGFIADDILYFSSYAKDKYLYVLRNGDEIHLADSLLFNSVWPIMFPGVNTFSVSPSPIMNWRFIEYYSTYWGI
jgi:hypothetical protein